MHTVAGVFAGGTSGPHLLYKHSWGDNPSCFIRQVLKRVYSHNAVYLPVQILPGDPAAGIRVLPLFALQKYSALAAQRM